MQFSKQVVPSQSQLSLTFITKISLAVVGVNLFLFKSQKRNRKSRMHCGTVFHKSIYLTWKESIESMVKFKSMRGSRVGQSLI